MKPGTLLCYLLALMSKLLNIDTQYYSRLERGDDPKRRFTLEKIILACALFNVTPNEIISKIPTGDENVYNTLEIQKDIKRGLKKLSPDKLKGLKDYINYIAVCEIIFVVHKGYPGGSCFV